MICFPPAKINIGLQVIRKRADGYHDIETVFYPVPCTDMLEIISDRKADANHPFVSIHNEGLAVDADPGSNLVSKAYQLLAQDHRLPPLQAILYKSIPMGAGLGGGSSDAAWMIRLLNKHANLGLTDGQMRHYASKLGSDCAFFITGTPAYAYGRGEELEDFDLDLSGLYCVLLYPGVHSSTAAAYSRVKKRGELTEATSLRHLLKQPIETWKDSVVNDFEASVFASIPQLPAIKQQLYESGALYASMSGSGSAMFGLFRSKPSLHAAMRTMICFEGVL